MIVRRGSFREHNATRVLAYTFARMQPSRIRLMLAIFALVVIAPCTRTNYAEDTPSRISVEKAVAFLMSKQGKDGGWHSETYGSLRQGASLTAFSLYGISHVPEEVVAAYRKDIQRGFDFLRTGIDEKGHVANPDGTSDYPSYASAMTLTAARRLKIKLSEDDEQKLIDYLIGAQLGESRKFSPDNPHYGGWDMTGSQLVLGQTSGTNVSLGRFVIEALSASDDAKAKAAVQLGRQWAHGCQNFPGDGGFFFVPEARFQSNKAQLMKDREDESERRPRSYGTTTCDGVCCLLYAGASDMDERVAAGVKWVVDRPTVDEVPGFEDLKPSTQWEKGLRYYYYAGLVKVLPYFPEEESAERSKNLTKKLLSDQRRDGSWKNESQRMREDDPLICTSLGLIAMAELVNHAK